MSVILATAGYDHSIRFWEAPSGVNSHTLRFNESQVNCLEITPNKQFLAAGGNPNIRLFEINDAGKHNQGVLTLEGHTSSVTSIGFQRDVRFLYSGSEDGTVKLFDLRSPNFSRSFDCKAPVNSVALHPNQAEIISGDSNGSVKVWDLGSSKCINDLIPDAQPPPSYASGSIEGTPPIVSTYCVQPQRVSIQAVDVSEDGLTCVAASNHADVYIWDPSNIRNFRPLAKFQAHPTGSYLLKAKISPDSRTLVTTSSDRTARLWDISHRSNNTESSNDTNGCKDDLTTESNTKVNKTPDDFIKSHNKQFQPTLTQTLAEHKKFVWDAVFSADSSYLVTASSDHIARLWNLRTGEVVRQYSSHHSAVITCVALNDSPSM